jgi:hypothetical protein
MSAHNEVTIKEFLKLCDWLMQTWQMRKYLFDENKDVGFLQSARHGHFFYRIQEVFQESWMNQLAKLHDPAVQGGNINLSIEYIVEFGGWNHQFKSSLLALKDKMIVLSTPVRTARNKLLSHNDLRVILAGEESFGQFNPGEDQIYFSALNEFCDLVSRKVLNEPFCCDDLVENDVAAFMSQFKSGET